jgi:lipopolysaccharide/colanic/teichoic acid biosynthesis glycosyltransferase
MKRFIDILISLTGLVFGSPFLLLFMYLVYRQDKKSPFYIAPRVGKGGKLFKMIKLRSMIINADITGVDSTSSDDLRITPVGEMIRKYKLDEFTQLFNVLVGNMSLVGPRPNVKKGGTDLYTSVEKRILTIRPGITDFSSIIFSDEGNILLGKEDPDLSYNQLIRPWKSRLALVYIDHQSIALDLKIIFYTLVAIISKQKSIRWVGKKLRQLNADQEIVEIAKRDADLYPFPPPGAEEIVLSVKA